MASEKEILVKNVIDNLNEWKVKEDIDLTDLVRAISILGESFRQINHVDFTKEVSIKEGNEIVTIQTIVNILYDLNEIYEINKNIYEEKNGEVAKKLRDSIKEYKTESDRICNEIKKLKEKHIESITSIEDLKERAEETRLQIEKYKQLLKMEEELKDIKQKITIISTAVLDKKMESEKLQKIDNIEKLDLERQKIETMINEYQIHFVKTIQRLEREDNL